MSGAGVGEYWQRNLVVCTAGSFTTIVAMTILVPFLPLYIERLGVTAPAEVKYWAGLVYAAPFFTAALTAPLWGWLGDRIGRKPMLIRASLGMAVAVYLTGLAQSPEQLVGFRLLTGLLGGYASGSTILVAAQTPRHRTGWALGMLSSGTLAGSVAGPLLGGVAPELVGIRATFTAASVLIFGTFVCTAMVLREDRGLTAGRAKKRVPRETWAAVSHKGTVVGLLALTVIVMLSTLSIEPILTLYVYELTGTREGLTMLAGVIFASSAIGSILSAPFLGRIADERGHSLVLSISLAVVAALLVLQAFAANVWALALLRLLMGVALGGLGPIITAAIRANLPDSTVGLVLGYNVSAQYVGQVAGPILGAYASSSMNISTVFLITGFFAMVGGVAAKTLRFAGNETA